jgi:dTDP-4-dehydrorhamnose reductase
MKWLVTGLSGTLAPVLARHAATLGVEVLGWDRRQVPPDDSDAARAWLQAQRPDAIAHLAMGSPPWAALLARHAAEAPVTGGLPFVFTSTAMVFHHQPDGPHAPGDARNAQDDYGRSKIACEDAVLAAHPGASIVRIGWQIDPARPGNNMLMALDRQQAEHGHVTASRAWTPACSFMDDTAAALVQLLRQPRPGVLHFDSNAAEAHSFAAIVQALQRDFGRQGPGGWHVREDDGYAHDQRLVDGPLDELTDDRLVGPHDDPRSPPPAAALRAPPLSLRLPSLRGGARPPEVP